MSSYQFVAGYNNAGTLAALSIQPKTEGVEDGRELVAGDGLSYLDGLGLTRWVYTGLSDSQYGTLLTAMGLTSAGSVKATVKTRTNQARGFANYNAIVRRPTNPRYTDGFWRNIVFEVTLVEAL